MVKDSMKAFNVELRAKYLDSGKRKAHPTHEKRMPERVYWYEGSR